MHTPGGWKLKNRSEAKLAVDVQIGHRAIVESMLNKLVQTKQKDCSECCGRVALANRKRWLVEGLVLAGICSQLVPESVGQESWRISGAMLAQLPRQVQHSPIDGLLHGAAISLQVVGTAGKAHFPHGHEFHSTHVKPYRCLEKPISID